jgi:hypothetical protein
LFVGLRAGPSGGLRLGTSARNGSSNRWTTSTTGRSDLTALEMFDELALAGGLAAIFLPIAVMTPGAFVIVVFLAIPVVLLALAGALLTAVVATPILVLRAARRLTRGTRGSEEPRRAGLQLLRAVRLCCGQAATGSPW